jgi:hypothetical protein
MIPTAFLQTKMAEENYWALNSAKKKGERTKLQI